MTTTDSLDRLDEDIDSLVETVVDGFEQLLVAVLFGRKFVLENMVLGRSFKRFDGGNTGDFF